MAKMLLRILPFERKPWDYEGISVLSVADFADASATYSDDPEPPPPPPLRPSKKYVPPAGSKRPTLLAEH